MSYKKSFTNARRLFQCIFDMLITNPILSFAYMPRPLYPLDPWKEKPNLWARFLYYIFAVIRVVPFIIGSLLGALIGLVINIPSHLPSLHYHWSRSRWWRSLHPIGFLASIVFAGFVPRLEIPLWSALLFFAASYTFAIIDNLRILIPSIYRYSQLRHQYETAKKQVTSLPNNLQDQSNEQYVKKIITDLKLHYLQVRVSWKKGRDYGTTPRHYTRTEQFKDKLNSYLNGSQLILDKRSENGSSTTFDPNEPKSVLLFLRKLATKKAKKYDSQTKTTPPCYSELKKLQDEERQAKEDHKTLKAYLTGRLSFPADGTVKQKKS